MERVRHCDLAIVGGGLAGGLIALALAQRRPETRLLIIDAGDTLGGNHIWSFFGSDLSSEDRSLVAPLVAASWDGYDVAFPLHRRRLAERYHSITSERFNASLRDALHADQILTGCPAIAVDPRSVTLANGTQIEAKGVIDARGPADLSALDCGWQKFLGQEVRLAAPHGLTRPVVMDATVEQADGYRFVYLLPFSPDRLFIEDTYYSDTAFIDEAVLARRIAHYAVTRGWQILAVERQETGALPVVLSGDFEAYWRSGDTGVAKAGARAGLFHPTTGYSLPDAAVTARLVASLTDWSSPHLHETLYAHARQAWRTRGFYRLLDTMLFRAAEPDQRYKVLERFYRLDPALVGRFYAGHSTARDKVRILVGRPPVPIGRAVRALTGFGGVRGLQVS